MLADCVASSSFLEYAFLRWVLGPVVDQAIAPRVHPQYPVEVDGRSYRVDYVVEGAATRFAFELDGYTYHHDRPAFTYDRLRQNDLTLSGLSVYRFSYDAVRTDTARCVRQVQRALLSDPALAPFVVYDPPVETPMMEPSPIWAASPPPDSRPAGGYFDVARSRLQPTPLRQCQREALQALSNYYARGERKAACVMSVGAGKTALGVAAILAFTRQRALVVTPGSVIRGTFARALDAEGIGNALYGLPDGPLLPGMRPPRTLVLDRESGSIRARSRRELLAADVVVTNFHALGDGSDAGDLLAKLEPDDVDFIVVDEAHIAAADSYRRLFARFPAARMLLVSACFQRLDGRPIDADVVYRYRLSDAIADGHAKTVRAHRFAPDTEATTYEVTRPDGKQEALMGREALLAIIDDERRLATITAKSEASIHAVMRAVRGALDCQAASMAPLKPRVLFAALGQAHEEQIARIATEHGIPSAFLHHSMSEAELDAVRARFERDSGDLQGLVQLRMLGQGYDFPPICVVVPMRPYGSFSEFYQFVGRGVRVVRDARLPPGLTQSLDVVYHGEFGLDQHFETLRSENGLDPIISDAEELLANDETASRDALGDSPTEVTARVRAEVVRDVGTVERRALYDAERVAQRKWEREQQALAQQYAAYAQGHPSPMTIVEFAQVVAGLDVKA